jgi:luciferase family oxidoreductase group 1
MSAKFDASRVRYSVLDLAPILPGGTAAQSFRNSLDLAQHAERLGYTRYWLAEHHNIPGIASAATSVVIGFIAGGTRTIRVGAGGIMLPNHSPLVIAEQFGTLESLYPGRIDLGIGRAPGGDSHAARALRRHLDAHGDTFTQDLLELIAYFRASQPGQPVRAIPGEGLNVPVYLLGSSDFSARLAAELGLPFAFASHFAPNYISVALELYRRNFKPSQWLDEPYVMVGVNIFAADTDDKARRLFTSLQQVFLNLVRGMPTQLPPPVQSMDGQWNAAEQEHIDRMLHYSVVGSPETIRQQFEALLDETQADEFICTAQIHDHAARVHSFEIVAQVMKRMNDSRAAAKV